MRRDDVTLSARSRTHFRERTIEDAAQGTLLDHEHRLVSVEESLEQDVARLTVAGDAGG